MKVIKSSEAVLYKNSDVCDAITYQLHEQKISIALIKLRGRYPSKGYAKNRICNELVYVIQGKGKLVVGNKVVFFAKGDVIVIVKGEKYYWEGKCSLLMPSYPAFSAAQHIIEN